MATTGEEEEWEYEYDDIETEDFYITLDLSNTPTASMLTSKPGPKPGHPTRLQSRLRTLNAARKETEKVNEATGNRQLPVVGEMQIIGLHTPNPLAMYNGELLSCKWASTIGTDLFFVKPTTDDETPNRTLRSLPAVDLLAMSSTKLTANVGLLRPRDELFVETHDNEDSTTNMADASTDAQTTDSNQSIVSSLQPSLDSTRSAPTGFLAKLNEAKAKRGERSRLVVSKTSNGTRIVVENVGKSHDIEDGASQ